MVRKPHTSHTGPQSKLHLSSLQVSKLHLCLFFSTLKLQVVIVYASPRTTINPSDNEKYLK